VSPADRGRFERAAAASAPELFRDCPEFLRHKELLLSPALLRSLGIPFTRITQRAREFVITAPAAYHAGFNHGLNCAESTNFGTAAWVPVGARAKSCFCQGDTVHIDMRLFGVEPLPARQRGRRRRARDEEEQGGEGQVSDGEVEAAQPPPKAERLQDAPVAEPEHGLMLVAPLLLAPGAATCVTAGSMLPFVCRLAGEVVRAGTDS